MIAHSFRCEATRSGKVWLVGLGERAKVAMRSAEGIARCGLKAIALLVNVLKAAWV